MSWSGQGGHRLRVDDIANAAHRAYEARPDLAAQVGDMDLQRIAAVGAAARDDFLLDAADRKSTRLNSSHLVISYAVFCLKKKKKVLTLTIHSPNRLTDLPTH